MHAQYEGFLQSQQLSANQSSALQHAYPGLNAVPVSDSVQSAELIMRML